MAKADDIGRDLADAARSAPYLERDEEMALAVRWKQARDEQALHKLAAAHMRLVLAVASRYRRYGLPLSDLVQEGNVGMLEAAARFEPSREVRFSTYASWWIRASIQDYILRNWSIVRGGTSSNQKALFFNLRRIRARLAQQDGGRTSTQVFEDVARALGVSRADVEMMDARLSGPDLSLNAPVGSGETREESERGDFLIDGGPLPDELVETSIDLDRRSAALRRALGALNARELRIVQARRLDEEPATLEALGVELGVSKERVRQLESRALEKLKAALEHSPIVVAALPGQRPSA
ncbi:MAG: RNA polymerase factor sigma-32 [Methylobacteriaceae bacterium]|nr:RNA polymerase factor sigma-32 [Methylobacteriaceae bacterium]